MWDQNYHKERNKLIPKLHSKIAIHTRPETDKYRFFYIQT